MGTGFLKRKKEAKLLQQQLSDMKTKFDTMEVDGQSGNGLVRVTLKGDFELIKLTINPECVDKDDVEGLQDLIKTAYADAKRKLDAESAKGMPSLPGGFPSF